LSLDGDELRCACDGDGDGDGEQGLTCAENFQPDVALLDIGLPNLNGYQIAQLLRATAWGKKMALLAISGWGQPAGG